MRPVLGRFGLSLIAGCNQLRAKGHHVRSHLLGSGRFNAPELYPSRSGLVPRDLLPLCPQESFALEGLWV